LLESLARQLLAAALKRDPGAAASSASGQGKLEDQCLDQRSGEDNDREVPLRDLPVRRRTEGVRYRRGERVARVQGLRDDTLMAVVDHDRHPRRDAQDLGAPPPAGTSA
jgi:hypothetical protein